MLEKNLRGNSKASFELNDLYVAALQTILDIYHDENKEPNDKAAEIWDFLYSFDAMAKIMSLYEGKSNVGQ